MERTSNLGTSVSKPPLNNGFQPMPPLVPIGTSIQSRNGNVLRSRRQWEELPLAQDAIAELIDHVHGEYRSDETVALHELAMDRQGRLVLHDQTIGVEQHGFRQLCSRASIPGGSTYLVACPPELRATNLNHWLGGTRGRQSKNVTLRMRSIHGSPTIYACVSPSYAAYDVPELLAETLSMLPNHARAEASYDGLRLRFRVVFDSEWAAADKNDVFKTGIEIASADDGTHALHVASLFWRVACTNLMLFRVEHGRIRKRIHKGSVAEMAASLFLGVREARAAVVPFQDAWQQARLNQVIVDESDRGRFVESLFRRKLIKVAGMRDEVAISAILSAWDREPGDSQADLVNAVTLAAHEAPWPSVAVAESLEEQAGRLLTAKLAA